MLRPYLDSNGKTKVQRECISRNYPERLPASAERFYNRCDDGQHKGRQRLVAKLSRIDLLGWAIGLCNP